MRHPPRQRGFTLVEMVITIVIMGILAGVLAPFIAQAVQSYRALQARDALTAKGRLALQRIAREVRQAIPNSLEVMGGGTGIQFLRSRAGGGYVEEGHTFGTLFTDLALQFRTGKELCQLYVLGTDLGYAKDELLVIANADASDLRNGLSVATLTKASENLSGSVPGSILQFDDCTPPLNQFQHASPGHHYQIADTTHEVGVTGDTLRWHMAPGLSGYDSNADWGAGDPILIDGVDSATFQYQAGTLSSSGVLTIDLNLIEGNESIRLYHEVHVRTRS